MCFLSFVLLRIPLMASTLFHCALRSQQASVKRVFLCLQLTCSGTAVACRPRSSPLLEFVLNTPADLQTPIFDSCAMLRTALLRTRPPPVLRLVPARRLLSVERPVRSVLKPSLTAELPSSPASTAPGSSLLAEDSTPPPTEGADGQSGGIPRSEHAVISTFGQSVRAELSVQAEGGRGGELIAQG